MSFEEDGPIRWRLHLASDRRAVFDMLATDEGRARFWAESARESKSIIHFGFPNGWEWKGEVLESDRPNRFSVRYFGDTVARFELNDSADGGTDLQLTHEGVKSDDRAEVTAGWVSVLMSLKAAVDHGVDLRNHDPTKTWDEGYADN